jgi:hypothetical protein
VQWTLRLRRRAADAPVKPVDLAPKTHSSNAIRSLSGIRLIASEFTIRIHVVKMNDFCRLSPALQASPMQKVIRHLMDFLKNDLSSKDNAYRRQDYLW